MAYAVLFSYGDAGIAAGGPTVEISYRGCPEARAVIEARVEAMGLDDARFEDVADGFQVTARLPADPRVVERLPKSLTLPGTFEVRASDAAGDPGELVIDQAGIEYATVYMTFLDTPRAHLKLIPEAAIRLRDHQMGDVQGSVLLFVNGLEVHRVYNLQAFTDGEIDLDRQGTSDLERMDFAAETAIVLDDGPLPCEVTLIGVEEVEPLL
jgi:hypothetical protein